MSVDRVRPTTAIGEMGVDRRSDLILVVDDSADMRSIIAEVLTSIGYEVVTVPSAAKALRHMSEQPPALVITDLLTPGMTGFALRSRMLQRAELSRIPVIVVSAYWSRSGETLDAAEVLTKPINLDRLIESVQRAIGQPAPAADAIPGPLGKFGNLT
ncbi:MAG: response regulator [Chloroflexota bacterium]